MEDIFHNITSDEDKFIPLIVFAAGTIIALIAIVFGAVKRMVVSSNVEKSRREIAAYIAEGPMSPEDGERLHRASGRVIVRAASGSKRGRASLARRAHSRKVLLTGTLLAPRDLSARLLWGGQKSEPRESRDGGGCHAGWRPVFRTSPRCTWPGLTPVPCAMHGATETGREDTL